LSAMGSFISKVLLPKHFSTGKCSVGSPDVMLKRLFFVH